MKKKRGLSPEQKECLRRLESWETKGTVLELPISASTRDGRTPIVDFGSLRIFLHAGWDVLIGAKRQMVVKKTASGRYFFAPADPKNLPAGEFDLDRPRYFSEVLKRKEGRYFFRRQSGQILIPLGQESWQEADSDRFLHKEVELIGWPRSTCFVVMPRHGWEHISMTTKLGTETLSGTAQREAREKAIRSERAFGLVRVRTATGEEIQIFANALLGIPTDAPLEAKEIKRHRAQTLKAQNIEQVSVFTVAGVELDKAGFLGAVEEATKLLQELAASGARSIAELMGGEPPEISEDNNDKEPPAPVAPSIERPAAAPPSQPAPEQPNGKPRSHRQTAKPKKRAPAKKPAGKRTKNRQLEESPTTDEPIGVLPRLSKSTEEKLLSAGVKTVVNLATYPIEKLKEILGPEPAKLWQGIANNYAIRKGLSS